MRDLSTTSGSLWLRFLARAIERVIAEIRASTAMLAGAAGAVGVVQVDPHRLLAPRGVEPEQADVIRRATSISVPSFSAGSAKAAWPR